eukprot:scaffold19386_cov68-Phaeocystis_antarctica.AAC.5
MSPGSACRRPQRGSAARLRCELMRPFETAATRKGWRSSRSFKGTGSLYRPRLRPEGHARRT